VATERRSLGQILKQLEKTTGPFITDRINIRVAPQRMEKLVARLTSGLKAIGSFPVEKFITTDGYKFLLPKGEWVAFRASGTEPVFRCYIEAKSRTSHQKLRQACTALLRG
jgi:phosphoglucomutase